MKKDGRIWIPDDVELQFKILVCSHCGTIGHRGMDATRSILRESFWWPTMDKDVDELVRGCFHCIVTRTGEIIPRPLGHAIHGGRLNEVVHTDFLYMGPGADSNTTISLPTFGYGQRRKPPQQVLSTPLIPGLGLSGPWIG